MKRLVVAMLLSACAAESEPHSLTVPAEQDFNRVSNMLQARCGSLDCHGQAGRNMRLYGERGLRLSSNDVPGGTITSPDEHAANYASVVALEPEILSRVHREHGAHPERLTLVRKGRNAEQHTGGHALNAAADSCLTSWLAGAVDHKACFDGSVITPPPGFSGGGSGGAAGMAGAGGMAGGGGAAGAGGSGGGTGGGGGVVCSPGEFWPCTFDANCSAEKTAPADHDAYMATNCLDCHVDGADAGASQAFLFAGFIWDPYTPKGAPKIEVGVRDGDLFYYACTDALGFFFIPESAGPDPDWTKAETRIRTDIGEKIMPPEKKHEPGCNAVKDCHGNSEHKLIAPL